MKFKPFFLEFLACLIVALFFMARGCQRKKEADLWKAQAESGSIRWASDMQRLSKEKNKLGQEVATITALHQMTIEQLTATQAELGSTMERLQKEVKKNTALASVSRHQTSGELVAQTDTVFIDAGDSLPVYQTSVEDRWSRFDIMASPDTFLIDYTVYNEFVFKSEWKRSGLFKPRYLEASVTSLNPNTETIGLSTWQAPKSKPKRLAWLGVGVGIGFAGAIYLFAK